MDMHDKTTIARYLFGELSPEENAAFEKEMASNTAFSREVTAYRETMATLEQRLPAEDASAAVRETLKSMNASFFQKKEAKLFSIPRYVYAGVAAAAIIAIIFIWPSPGYIDRWGNMKMMSSQERGGGADSVLQAASVFFNQEKYQEALPLLDKAVMMDTANQMALFYRGICLFYTGEVVHAREDLQKVYNGSSVFRYEAAFFIALGYADEKNTVKTREWVRKIPPGTPVSEKAGELKEALDEAEK